MSGFFKEIPPTMNTNKQPWTYYVRRIAFSIYQTLGLVKQTRSWTYATRDLFALSKNVWYSLLSMWYSLCSLEQEKHA